MGLEIDKDRFEAEDYDRFRERLTDGLSALEELLSRPGFGAGAGSIGAELECALIDRDARPLPLNVEVLQETVDPRMTVELDRFNLECNLRHTDLAGRPFDALRDEIVDAERELNRAASVHGGRVVMVGILPTVREDDLAIDGMTDTARFRALSYALRHARRGPFTLRIAGEEPLRLDCENVTYEGAATSLQIHLRVEPRRFGPLFNAVQLATAPVLAVAGNSPLFLGHHLWEETRVALFKQAVDDRGPDDRLANRKARVAFGSGWIQDGALELFATAVSEYPPLLPVLGDEDPLGVLREGRVPRLGEIRLHQGTVWHWNRPVYDPAGGGHLRIEVRALPSGPSVEDILANMAFVVGLAFGLEPAIEDVTADFDFEAAHANFYRAAQDGLAARLVWPAALGGGDGPIPARVLVPRLLEYAAEGLRRVGADAGGLLDVIAARAERGLTGAAWQRLAVGALEAGSDRETALRGMVERYVTHQAEGRPVHEWPLANGADPGAG